MTNTMESAFDILEQRGFIYQSTDADQLRQRLADSPVTFYVGFDPTADSLHVGHLLPLMAMRCLQRCGHRPIALVGGGTAMVGDPTGRTSARPVLTRAEIESNSAGLRRQLNRFLEFGDGKAVMVDNADWLSSLNYIEFLRDVGRHFSVNRMLAAESVKMRLEVGLSFLEFNYMLLQAYDFVVLCRDMNCEFQFGGQDQWGNIVAGVDLARRMLQREVYAATFPLLLKSDGEKFGKTAGAAVWLDPERTSPYDYYQFWRNADDQDVGRLLSFFTDLPVAEIQRLAALPAPDINRSKEILGFEATTLAHGEDEARNAYLAAGAEFGFADPGGRIDTSSRIADVSDRAAGDLLPTHSVTAEQLAHGLWIVQLLKDSGLCASNGEARRLVRGGGCYVNDGRVADEQHQITAADLRDGQLLLRAGKKNVRRIIAGNV